MPYNDPGMLYPPNYEWAMIVLRFANAESSALGTSSFRYQLDANIHEPLDPESDLSVWDDVDETWMTVADVFATLCPKNAYWAKYQLRAVLLPKYRNASNN